MLELAPEICVRGMTKLDRAQFSKKLQVPCLKINNRSVGSVTRSVKKYLLKLSMFKAIRTVEDGGSYKEIILNPKLVSSFNDITEDDRNKLTEAGIDEACFTTSPLELTYENWTADEILNAVLPEDKDTAASYSIVGHIVHVNLREHLQIYKNLIGEVLLDKIKNARTVVNKVDTIDNTFRVFKMEVLAGEHDFITEVKENNFRFKFDFSSVYWNPRLSTEHERIIKKLSPGNVVYDVFAGVGPFSIPAAKKNCTVLANDLNPESFKWLKHNAELNKLDKSITVYNKDGFDFIRENVKQHMILQESKSVSHVVMNLPATAATFLNAFKQLFSADELKHVKVMPLTHVYCFVKGEGDTKEMAKTLIEKELNCSISSSIDEITFVRNVAPNKDMMRVSFQLTENILLTNKRKFEDFDKDIMKSV